jgi:hypothetical protein
MGARELRLTWPRACRALTTDAIIEMALLMGP